MSINKFLHSPNVAGQSLVDRVNAAKHSLAGERLAKFVCKATTEEQIPPKKKHIDRKYSVQPRSLQEFVGYVSNTCYVTFRVMRECLVSVPSQERRIT